MFRPRLEDRPGHLVRAVGRAALAAERVGLGIDALELIERDVGRHVDRLRDRAVDVALRGGEHDEVVVGRQGLRIDEIVRQRRAVAFQPAEKAIGVVGDLLLAPAAVRHQDVARVAEAENRFEAGGHIVGEQRDRAGRRDRG
jgi:hypothetical protein